MTLDPNRDNSYYMNPLSVDQKQELQRLADQSETIKPQDFLIEMIAKHGFEKVADELPVQRNRVYSKDTESLLQACPLQRKRTFSLPPLNILSQEIPKEKALEGKTGEIWDCIDRQPNKSQGYLYHFQMKKEYDADRHPGGFKGSVDSYQETFDRIFPAVEPITIDIEILLLDPSLTESQSREIIINAYLEGIKCELLLIWDEIYSGGSTAPEKPHILNEAITKFIKVVNEKFDYHPEIDIEKIKSACEFKKSFWDKIDPIILKDLKENNLKDVLVPLPFKFADLNRLGYSSFLNEQGKRILVLPDKDALIANWEILREEINPNLPPLDIKSSEGVADDISFIEAFFTSDVLLSEGREFVHDHLNHVISTISMILTASPATLSTVSDYKQIKSQLVKGVMGAYHKIMIVDRNIGGAERLKISKEQLEKFKVSLGALVDILSIFTLRDEFYQEPLKLIESMVSTLPLSIWNPAEQDNKWAEQFWNRRFNNEELKIDELTKTWDEIQNFVQDFKNRILASDPQISQFQA